MLNETMVLHLANQCKKDNGEYTGDCLDGLWQMHGIFLNDPDDILKDELVIEDFCFNWWECYAFSVSVIDGIDYVHVNKELAEEWEIPNFYELPHHGCDVMSLLKTIAEFNGQDFEMTVSYFLYDPTFSDYDKENS